MANFEMMQPDVNELFGFNAPPSENVGKIKLEMNSRV